MAPPGILVRDLQSSAVHIVVLHDDHLTATRGAQVARSIADEMALAQERETKLWNVALLDTHFAPSALGDASDADLLVVALRDVRGISANLKLWLRHWLHRMRNSSAALIVVLENGDPSASIDARAFVERAAHSEGKDFFSESTDVSSMGGGALGGEFLWVL